MELIKQWLSGSRNYHVGAVLYQKYGDNEKLKKLLDGPPSDNLVKMLTKELEALLTAPSKPAPLPLKSAQIEEMPDSSDQVLQALKNEWKAPFQRMNYLRHELDRYLDDNSEQQAIRRRLAEEILELEQQCMLSWERRNHYLAKGQLPEVKEDETVIPDNPEALGRLIETTKRNIRRNKDKAAKYPDNPAYAFNLQKYQQLLQKLLNHGK